MKRILNKLKPLEIGLKKAAVRLVSPLLACRGKNCEDWGDRKWRKILLIRHEKIGDVIIALTLVEAIKRYFPGCKVSFLASPQNVMVIRDDPRFDNVFVFNKSLWPDLRMILAARREKFECVIDLITHDSVTSLLLTRVCGPRALKIGIGKADHQDYYSFHAPHPLRTPDRHIIDFHLDLLKILGAEPAEAGQYVPPHIDSKAHDTAMEFMRSLNISDGLKIGLNISAGEPTRNWGADNFGKLAEKILNQVEDSHLIIITAPGEYALGVRIKEAHDKRVHIIPEGLDLITVAGIIKYLDMLVSPDTSLVHIAGALKVPVVALYRRFMGEYKFWCPRHQKSGVVLSENDNDVFDISINRVMDEIVKVIDEFNLVGNNPCPVSDGNTGD